MVNAMPEGSGAICWPELLRYFYFGDLMSDRGLRTLCHLHLRADHESGRAQLSSAHGYRQRQAHACARDGAQKRY